MRENQYASYVHKRNEWNDISEIDRIFCVIKDNLANIEQPLVGSFLLRSHSAYRIACSNCMAGAIAETFPQLRLSIEYAAVGLKLNEEVSIQEVFLKRHDDEECLKNAKTEFHISRLKQTIRDKSPSVANAFDKLYEQSIDFGAHPNLNSIVGNMTLERTDESELWNTIYLHSDGTALEYGLKSLINFGICSLSIFESIYDTRFKFLRLSERLLRLRSKY